MSKINFSKELREEIQVFLKKNQKINNDYHKSLATFHYWGGDIMSQLIILGDAAIYYNLLQDFYEKNPSFQAELNELSNDFFKNQPNKTKLDIVYSETSHTYQQQHWNGNSNQREQYFIYDFVLKDFDNVILSYQKHNHRLYSGIFQAKDKYVGRTNCRMIFPNPSSGNNHELGVKFFTSIVPVFFWDFYKEFSFISPSVIIQNSYIRISQVWDNLLKYFPFDKINCPKIIEVNILDTINSISYSPQKFNEGLFNKYGEIADTKDFTILINKMFEINTSIGYMKDLDAYNAPYFQNIENFFEKFWEKISPEDYTKLRFLRNIAERKNVNIEFEDGRASVNSVTEKKLIIFGDRINCEAVLIDTILLASRFSTKFHAYEFKNFVETLFKYGKDNKIFSKYCIIEGKRSFSNISTILFEKGKSYSEENIEILSRIFETAVILSNGQQNVNFYDALSTAHHEIVLEQKMEERSSKEVKVKLTKNKV